MKRIRINRLIILLLFVFMICFGIIAFIRSDFFALRNIKIVNNNILTKSEIDDLSKITTGKNIFTYDLKKIDSNIRQSKYVKDVTVTRKIPNSLIINISEKQVYCALEGEDDYYYVDKNMHYIDKLKKQNLKENCLIVNIDFFIKNNKIYFKREKDKISLVELIENINNYGLDKKVDKIDFLENDKISLKIGKNMEAIIDENKNMKNQISKLTKVLIDLQNRDVYYGKIDMTFSKYILYTY